MPEKPIPTPCPASTCSAADFRARAFSSAGARRGFGDPRGTLFFELARLAEARHPRYLLFENVANLLYHDQGRTFATILHALDRLGYHVEWQVLNSKDFGVPQSRRRVYIVGFLDARCAGKILPFTETTAAPAARRLGGRLPGKGGHPQTGYKLAYPGDSISLAYATTNTRRGRVGHGIAHTLTTSPNQGVLCFVDMNEQPDCTSLARCLTAKQNGGIRNHRREASGVLCADRIRRLTPRECLRLQGWRDDRIDRILAVASEAQAYRAGRQRRDRECGGGHRAQAGGGGRRTERRNNRCPLTSVTRSSAARSR